MNLTRAALAGLLVIAASVASLTAEAQPRAKVPRLGVLFGGVTARSPQLGLTIPPSLLLRADRVIE